MKERLGVTVRLAYHRAADNGREKDHVDYGRDGVKGHVGAVGAVVAGPP